MQTSSQLKTPFAATYLTKLCRHLARKVPATQVGDRALIEFSFGRCRIDAEADRLRLRILLNEPGQADFAERLLSSHLVRIARDEQPVLHWQREETQSTGSTT